MAESTRSGQVGRDPVLVLASASPRRRELLSVLRPEFTIDAADLDESLRVDEPPARYVGRMAREKAEAVAARSRDAFVLGADTTVVIDGCCLGKPSDDADARRMLASLSGRWHEVYSAVSLVGSASPDGSDRHEALSVTRVRLDRLPPDWIERYVASGEPMDKAGGYAIQGAAAAWISEIRGSYSGVVGLPLYETAGLMRQAGLL